MPTDWKVAAISVWDYAHGDGRALNESAYGKELAEHYDRHYREAIGNRWLPDYAKTPWKMALMVGHNPANWRASGGRWRESVFGRLDTIVAMPPDMSVTAMYADYVLPISHHYERHDVTMEGRTPYLQVLDQAVPPLGEAPTFVGFHDDPGIARIEWLNDSGGFFGVDNVLYGAPASDCAATLEIPTASRWAMALLALGLATLALRRLTGD